MTKQGEQVKVSPVKENVVEGVLQNYLDQLLVTATSPQKVEKAILIPEVDEVQLQVESTSLAEPLDEPLETDMAAPVEIAVSDIPVIIDVANTAIEAAVETPVEEDAPCVELISIDSTLANDAITEAEPLLELIDQESWSSQGVECLVFSVGGLKLAVPLLLLGGVHEVDAEDVKPLMGQPNWYLGMVHKNEQNLQVIDTASFIMPERTQSLAEQGYKYLIQLEKTPWTIACQSIDDTVRLEANEIKWRGDRGKRAWLAGTVIEKMCALIDVSGLLQQVESSCKPV